MKIPMVWNKIQLIHSIASQAEKNSNAFSQEEAGIELVTLAYLKSKSARECWQVFIPEFNNFQQGQFWRFPKQYWKTIWINHKDEGRREDELMCPTLQSLVSCKCASITASMWPLSTQQQWVYNSCCTEIRHVTSLDSIYGNNKRKGEDRAFTKLATSIQSPSLYKG